jgi:hypothetical protein
MVRRLNLKLDHVSTPGIIKIQEVLNEELAGTTAKQASLELLFQVTWLGNVIRERMTGEMH